MVIIRSSWGIALDNAFRNVVLPEDVPPPIRIEYLAFTRCSRKVAASLVILSFAIRSSIVIA